MHKVYVNADVVICIKFGRGTLVSVMVHTRLFYYVLLLFSCFMLACFLFIVYI